MNIQQTWKVSSVCGIAYCSDSNLNLILRIARVKNYLEKKINVGLGNDVAAGHTCLIIDNLLTTIQVSKLKWLANNYWINNFLSYNFVVKCWIKYLIKIKLRDWKILIVTRCCYLDFFIAWGGDKFFDKLIVLNQAINLIL